MDAEAVLRIAREGLLLVLIVSSVPVLAAMLTGLIVSLFQAATQLQEQTLTVVPKIIAVFLALMIAGPWMLAQLLRFSDAMLQLIQQAGTGVA